MSIALPKTAQAILSGKMAEKQRQGIASGAAPLPPIDLVSSLAVIIARDPDKQLREKATTTLVDLPEQILNSALDQPLAEPVFRVLYQKRSHDRSFLEKLTLNAAIPADVLAAIAKDEKDIVVLELIAKNQNRLLNHIEIVEALLENPSLGPALRSSVEEFFGRAFAGKLLLQSGEMTKEELQEEGVWDDELSDEIENAAAADQSLAKAEVPEELLATDESEILEDDEAHNLLAAAAGEEDADVDALEKTGNLRAALSSMTVTQKIKLAISGGKEARSLLVMDGNKIISGMVIRNPRISEREVVAIASSKSVRDDLLRAISRDKKFMKSYSVKQALVVNRKTPQAIALTLLGQLRDNDIKMLSKSRGVSNAVKTQAKRIAMKKGL